VLLLAGLFALFNILFYGWIAESVPFNKYLALNARASIPLIRFFGADASAEGTSVRSSRFGLEIKHGCDALQPTAFFMLAILASPVPIPIARRLLPILAGTSILLLLNLVRILTLFYAGIKIPTWFETLHQDIWQALFIFLPLVFWIGWVLRVTRPPTRVAHGSS